MQRRAFLNVLVTGLTAAWILPAREVKAALAAMSTTWNKPAFDATKMQNALQALAITGEIKSDDIQLIAPDKAENGAIVQIEVTSNIPNTEAIYVLVEHNPTALIGQYAFKNGAQPFFITRIKMAETSDIKVIVKAGTQFYTASKKVEVLENGCGGGGSANEKFETSMKLRAKLTTDVTEVKAIIIHPMHTGRGKADNGELIPAHFIQTVTVSLNEKPVLEMQLGTGISKNPYLTFKLAGATVGDKITVSCADNLGLSATQSIEVIQA